MVPVGVRKLPAGRIDKIYAPQKKKDHLFPSGHNETQDYRKNKETEYCENRKRIHYSSNRHYLCVRIVVRQHFRPEKFTYYHPLNMKCRQDSGNNRGSDQWIVNRETGSSFSLGGAYLFR